MKEYSFEYTRQYVILLAFLVMFGMIAACVVILIHLIPGKAVLSTIVAIVLPVAIFLIIKSKFRRRAKAEISETGIVFFMPAEKRLSFAELKYYYSFDAKNGPVLTLGLLDGTKFKIGANNNFCDSQPLETLIAELQSDIEKYKAEHQANIVHLESIYSRKNTIYFLVFFTVLVILGYIFTKMPLMIAPIAFSLPLIVNWIKYFQLKRNNELVDF